MEFHDEIADGREVRIYAQDAGGEYPIHGAIKDGKEWSMATWTRGGYYYSYKIPSHLDLVRKEKRHAG